eukprot:CAMPEP_0183526734 /NCGR_PEP_ID=MMETSP0371-20130417/21531_1 /TAXON_ID=268820 /ORGANISM="Peridinium aciculiferum, Strain PAER-2" /LENGTH=125 /DNA_ID=CAMNT_0025726123 /DNA_START=123 /DNA_END=497 /DNA_ORIENTATION=-
MVASRQDLGAAARGHPAVGQAAHAVQPLRIHEAILGGVAGQVRRSPPRPQPSLAGEHLRLGQGQHEEEVPHTSIHLRVRIGVGLRSVRRDISTTPIAAAHAVPVVAADAVGRDRRGGGAAAGEVP